MSRQVLPPNRGYDAVVKINGIIVAGQSNVTIDQTMVPINITNKITGEWSKSLAGVRSWAVTCSGMSIQGSAAFDSLKEAFENGSLVEIEFTDDNLIYKGNAYITSFPLVSNFNTAYTYRIRFQGDGQLTH